MTDLFLDFRTVGPDHRMTAPCFHHDRWFVVQLVNGRDEVRVSDEFETLDEAREELRRLDGRGERPERREESVSESTLPPIDSAGPENVAPVPPAPRLCEACGSPLGWRSRAHRRTCSSACRLALHRRENPDAAMKDLARRRVAAAIASGNLLRARCAECGAVGTEAHHPFGYDGENALRVEFLCRTHHALRHPNRPGKERSRTRGAVPTQALGQ
jgi:hypothetical protein